MKKAVPSAFLLIPVSFLVLATAPEALPIIFKRTPYLRSVAAVVFATQFPRRFDSPPSLVSAYFSGWRGGPSCGGIVARQ